MEFQNRQINYDVSDWFNDLLPLKEGLIWQDDSELLKIPMVELRNAIGTKGNIDFVFTLDHHVLVTVCLKEHKIDTYYYREKQKVSTYIGENSKNWLDVSCSVQMVKQKRFPFSQSYFLFVLAEDGNIIKISIHPTSYKIFEEYRFAADNGQQYKKILMSESENALPFTSDPVYLWSPAKKMLRRYTLYENSDGKIESKLEREVRVKPPKRTYNGNVSEMAYDPEMLTMCLDKKGNSVICADRTNHILFECSLRDSDSRIICGQGMPGCSMENTDASLAFLDTPCAPLVVRPQEFIPISHFAPSAKKMISAGTSWLPRLILVCDAGNCVVRKIWQFPNGTQMMDLAGLNHMYTLLGYVEDHLEMSLLRERFREPKALFLGLQGRMTVTTATCVYILAARAVVLEEKSEQAGLGYLS